MRMHKASLKGYPYRPGRQLTDINGTLIARTVDREPH
jgi:hypothetical protein